MIEVTNLVKRYGDRNVVDNLSFTVDKGQIVGFLGPNGAGKSTTMNIITGYISATSGTVKVNGYDIYDDPEKAKADRASAKPEKEDTCSMCGNFCAVKNMNRIVDGEIVSIYDE